MLGRLEEAGPSRARFPRSGRRGAALEAVLINTGGGIAGGDAVATHMIARAGAHLVATTQAAEKIYRSDGAVSKIDVDLLVEPGASLDWLPQWTILFDEASVARTISAEVGEGARLLLVEPVALGRAARGERFATGALTDRWRIRRNGRLIYADGLSLGGDIATLLDRPGIAHGAAAFATVLLVAPTPRRGWRRCATRSACRTGSPPGWRPAPAPGTACSRSACWRGTARCWTRRCAASSANWA